MFLGVRRGSGAPARRVLATVGPLLVLIPSLVPGAAALEGLAYVVGSNDGRIARVDLETGAVEPGILTVGTAANRIEITDDGSWAVVVNSGSDDVTAVDLLAETAAPIALPSGTNPWAAELLGERVFVTALLRNRVYEVSRPSATVVDSADVGTAPEGMAVAGAKLYVANTGFDFDDFTYAAGSVTVLSAADLSLVTTIAVGLNPQECLLAPDGRIHVICTGDFSSTTGWIHVIDPEVDAVVDSLSVGGYPGGGVVAPDGAVHLNVTTPAFSSELHSYDSATLVWIRDGTDPLLPSFDFYGNPRVDDRGRILLPDFTQDLLIVEDPAAPGSPTAHLVGDGPIDVAFVPRETPVTIRIRGLTAVSADEGVRLSWRTAVDSDVSAFRVARSVAAGPFVPVATDLAVRDPAGWVDRNAPTGPALAYRVGAVDSRGAVVWSSAVPATRRANVRPRLAVRRVSPNPSAGPVALAVTAPAGGRGSLEILDVRGRRVAIRETGPLTRGDSEIRWDGRDDRGRGAAPGMYFARLTVGDETAIARMIRVR